MAPRTKTTIGQTPESHAAEPRSAAKKTIGPSKLKLNTEAKPRHSHSQQAPAKTTSRSIKLKPESKSNLSPERVFKKAISERLPLFSERNETALHAIRMQLERLHENVTAVLEFHNKQRKINRQDAKNDKPRERVASMLAMRPTRRLVK